MQTYLDVTHIAIGARDNLRAAEAYYCELFDLEVAWREPVPDDAPFDLSWEELATAGVQPVIVLLHAGVLRIAVVEAAARFERPGPIEHVGVQVSAEQLTRVRDRVLAQQLQLVSDRPGELLDFIDRYGVEWELDTRSFANPVAIMEQKRERARRN
jgi:catechol 2,3-dioxygenase-like lactoylglutathione lyase family enzyme